MKPLPLPPIPITPGLLPDHTLEQLIRRGAISAPVPFAQGQIQPASLDLRLGMTAYRMPYSLLPHQQRWLALHPTHDALERLSLTEGAVLHKGQIYLIPLLESLDLPSHVEGRTNPKSTTGRSDLFCRVLTTGSTRFDLIPAGYRGPLFLEVFPRSFSVHVKTGLSLTQLRLHVGQTTWNDITTRTVHTMSPLAYHPETGGPLHLDHLMPDGLLCRVTLPAPHQIAAFRAKTEAPVLDLTQRGTADPTQYWDPLFSRSNRTLILEPESFYLLGSYERLAVPLFSAAEVAAYELSLGELRTHYAGFFDPGFGVHSDGPLGTPAVLEVRPHDLPCLIEDQQPLFKISYASLQSHPTTAYGPSIGSTYHAQGLTLSKHFRPWPIPVATAS